MKLLLIEDDKTIADYILAGLRQEGHVVDHMADGRDALSQAMASAYDVLIVDRMLPGLDGLSLVRALRAAKVMTPAIFLTALGGVDDRACRPVPTTIWSSPSPSASFPPGSVPLPGGPSSRRRQPF